MRNQTPGRSPVISFFLDVRAKVAALTLAMALLQPVLMAGPAEARTTYTHSQFWCHSNWVQVFAPEIAPRDGFQDVALIEVFRWTGKAWQLTARAGGYNGDLWPKSPPGTSPVGGIGPHLSWFDSQTHQERRFWNFSLPKGTYVSVKMWVADGETGMWLTPQWASITGTSATVCRTGSL